MDIQQSFTSYLAVFIKSFASRSVVVQWIKSFVLQLDQHWQQSTCVCHAPRHPPRHKPDDDVAEAVHFSSTTHVYDWQMTTKVGPANQGLFFIAIAID